ncbi:toxin ParE1/3/4 [Gammaproteobacteria bacterium]
MPDNTLPKAESRTLMFVNDFRLELSEPAQQDFRDILSFTLQTWGEGQLADYKNKLDSALKAIVKHPQIGRTKHGMLVYHIGRHLIFYRIDETTKTIFVVRILHERMDAARHLT